MYEKRLYRNRFKGANLQFFDVRVYETDLRIGAHKNLYNEALTLVEKYRAQLELYIRLSPEFLTSLEPIKAQPGAPYIAERMCEAAAKAGVGPMAAVAGAFSELVGKELLKFSDEIIVENGGDIFIKTDVTRKVGIFAGNSPLSEKIAIEISPDRTPMGICTSSGTIGHSLSFGKADAAVILAKDTFLADAVATAVGNIAKTASDIGRAVEYASTIDGVEGAMVIIGETLGAWGDIKLVEY